VNRRVTLLAALVVVGSTVVAAGREPDAVLNLWPAKAPGETKDLPPEADTTKADGKLIAGKPLIRLGNVSVPTIFVFRPTAEKQNGAALIICPGGGYNILALDLEGTEVAEWFAERGVTCFVLKYRVPRRPDMNPTNLAALQDGQRAVSLVRSRAREWGVDPARIGILGFSAGGNLAGMTAMHFSERRYPNVDGADTIPSRPDFAVLVYPAYFVKSSKEDKNAMYEIDDATVKVSKETPPMFFVHAGDDGVPATNCVLMYLQLKKAGVPSELHIYPTGGHGYGLRPTEQPVTHWPERCYDWLKAEGWLAKK
jgi:acetyl esterase/lipase